jgi:phosphoketolase
MPMAALLLRDLVMPDFREYAVAVHKPGTGSRNQPELDRFHLAGDVADRVPRLARVGALPAVPGEPTGGTRAVHLRARRRFAGSEELDLALLR